MSYSEVIEEIKQWALSKVNQLPGMHTVTEANCSEAHGKEVLSILKKHGVDVDMNYQGDVCVEEYSKSELVQRFVTICNECEHLDKSGDCQLSHRNKKVLDENGKDYIVRRKYRCNSFENNNELKGMLYFAAKRKSLEYKYSASAMVDLSGTCEEFEVVYGTVDYTENLMVDNSRVNLISRGQQIVNELTYNEALEYAYEWISNK